MRILRHSGVWQNTEDEILKAAVMKYGLNQWARISSLLERRSPKQCKQRWYEWLSPKVRKSEWSREEEEKLLHLAKVLPNQWRTIAPLVGRTAAQCVEHYEQMLAQAVGGDLEATLGSARSGHLEAAPETRPARPDPVDMDEEEKEMLAEARARLANTLGKKAKRMARERRLEEARRLASQQKRRELKASGMITAPRRKVVSETNQREQKRLLRRGAVDYNDAIPYYVPVPAGSHDASAEWAQEAAQAASRELPLGDVANLDAPAAKRVKRTAPSSSSSAAPRKDGATEDEVARPWANRTLSLPAAQIGPKELEEIRRLGYSVEDLEAELALQTPKFRAPKTPLPSQSLQHQIRGLLEVTGASTPLLKSDPDGPTAPLSSAAVQIPVAAEMQTPNPYKSVLSSHWTPSRATQAAVSWDSLPAPSARVNRLAKIEDSSPLLSSVAVEETHARLPLASAFGSTAISVHNKEVEDASVRDRRRDSERTAMRERLLAARSSVLQRGDLGVRLESYPTKSASSSKAALAVAEELRRWMEHEKVLFPGQGTHLAGDWEAPSPSVQRAIAYVQAVRSPHALARAEELIRDSVRRSVAPEDIERRVSQLTRVQNALWAELDASVQIHAEEAEAAAAVAEAARLEAEADLRDSLVTWLNTTAADIATQNNARIALAGTQWLASSESAELPRRLSSLQSQLADLTARERELQRQFADRMESS